MLNVEFYRLYNSLRARDFARIFVIFTKFSVFFTIFWRDLLLSLAFFNHPTYLT